jgi:hypothetical protein
MGASGGGGGYSGGAGGPTGGYSGGGGCFLKFTGGRQHAALDNYEDGFVIISLIGLKNDPPIPINLYMGLSGILGVGVAAWCTCLMTWISKCLDWIIGEDKELVQMKANRATQLRQKQLRQQAEYEQALQDAVLKRYVDDNFESGFSSELSFPARSSVRRRSKKDEELGRRGRSPTVRGRKIKQGPVQNIPYRMADAGSPPPSTKPPKSTKTSFRSMISSVASALSMAEQPHEEEDIPLEDIIEIEDPDYAVNREGYRRGFY